MIEAGDAYKVVVAMAPLYVALGLGYASVKWWRMFKPDQCDAINRFNCYFIIPFFTFQFTAGVNPYAMNFRFLAGDVVAKAIAAAALALWANFGEKGNFSWAITAFSMSSFNNTLVVGVPLLRAMYGAAGEDLVVQSSVIQSLLWFPILLFMLEFWRVRCSSYDASDEENPQPLSVHDAKHCVQENSNNTIAVVTGRVITTVPPSLNFGSTMKKVGAKLGKNPNCYACALGVIWALLAKRWDFEMPSLVEGSILIMAKAGSGVAMFSIGLFMALQEKLLACGVRLTIYGMVLRFVDGPLATSIGSLAFGLRSDTLRIAIIQATHPDVINLFESVGVDLEASDVSFSVSLDEGRGYEWGTRNGFSSFFAERMNVFNPWFWKMMREIIKFKNDAYIYLEKLENNPEADRNETLANFVQSHGYSELFQKAFLIPICASIWCYSSGVMTFSAYLVLSFLSNDVGMEFLRYPRRSTARWSSQSYVKKIMEVLKSRSCQVKINSEVYSVRTDDDGTIIGCVITNMDGLEEAYDECIITTHAPDALKILGKQATFDELRILGAFRFISSDIFLHHDDNLMPKNRAAWGFRNVLGTTKDEIYTATYLLNNAQNISKPGVPFLLTLNPPFTPKDTLYKYSSRHPIPSVAASKASSEVSVIQGKRKLWFCGASQGCGLPEDGVKAGIISANSLLRKSYTIKNNPKCIVPSWAETGALVVVSKFLERFIVTGSVILLEEGGTVFTFEGTKRNSALKVTLRVHSPQFYWKVAIEAEIGFAKAYINGDISFVDKNKGLFNFLLIIIANNELNNNASKLNKKRGWWTPLLYTSLIASTKYFLKNVSSKNTLSKARQNVFQHYDLSNEFFSLFMSDSMDYSCAIFQTPGEDLKSAQLRKVHTLIAKARINKEHHILEIGCGWGALALEVVRKTGCKYTGITLSVNQLNYVESKVKEAGLQDRIEVLLCDYRQLPNNYKYDRILSCEMIEHVGHEFMEEFFKCCESALAENGLFVLQFSSVADDKYDEWRLGRGFIKEYIFPGGCLPSLSRLTSAMATASRLGVVHLEEIGPHYVDTLKYWRQNLLQNQSKILAMGFSEEFIRTWEYYFDYCAAGFKSCIIGNYQIVFCRPGDVAALGNDPYNSVPSSKHIDNLINA